MRSAARREAGQGVTRAMVFLVLAVTLVVRLLHLRYALNSPLTYQPGPDEDFYFRFGKAVAAGLGNDSTEFAFMDPFYGYMLGTVFKVAGANLFVVYLLQVLLDTLTAYCIFQIGRLLDRPRAGLIAALLYGLACTAVLFTTTLLKATWVANYMVLWVLFGLVLLRTQKLYAWLLFGIWCGYGVALRGNLTLMVGLAVLLLGWLNVTWAGRSTARTASCLALLLLGVALPLLLLATRNEQISKSFTLLPNNGGVVLHQVYNPDNPRGVNWVPKFVNYSHPTETWRGYAAEAERRLGRSLTPHEVDQYWRSEAVAYIKAEPMHALGNVARKFTEFFAYLEIPNNRSLPEERLFSPVLRTLPSPFGWLLAFGVPGLAILLYRDRRALLAIAPIAVALFTCSVFFAEDRFRFHAVPMLALGSGLFLDDVHAWVKTHQPKKWAIGIVAAGLIGCSSVLLARQMTQPPVTWDRIVWGYIRMGKLSDAKALATKLEAEQPPAAPVQEALGYLAVGDGDAARAIEHYRLATQLRPDSHVAHYNLAKMLAKTGAMDDAASEAAAAVRIAPLPEYQTLLEQLTSKK
jgi:4-amino-4-deoxy-L-arabinose transferase-like glycosyltransferase